MEHKGQVIRHLSLAWVVQDPKNSFVSCSAREWTEFFSGATMGALEAPARPDLNRFDFAPGLDFPVVALLGAGVLSGGRPGQSRAAGRSVDFPGRLDFSCCSAAHLLAGDSVCGRRP